MFLKLNSAAVNGLDCLAVDVEVDINKGQSAFSVVGLPDTSIHEAKERIHSAIKNSGFNYPFNFRILVNLAPGDLHKEGPSYDLPMAVGLIALSNDFKIDLDDAVMVGELALDGSLRHTNGILPIAIFAKKQGLKRIFLPEPDATEAALVEGLEIFPVKNLRQIIAHLLGEKLIAAHSQPLPTGNADLPSYELDMAMIKGQEFAKRALEIAAAGSHNILMSGPPGSGKTLLARTLPSILPPLTKTEMLEITKIYSVGGLLQKGFLTSRPFRAPHHTASDVALVGGGKYPRPGEISLAHRGVLFLDEFPEFPRSVLESLRQPLEDGIVTVSRAQGALTFPARFILVASQNPCPCGYATDPEKQCTCGANEIIRYQKKVSGPILDRIDLHIEVPGVNFEKLASDETGEPSEKIRHRIEEARQRQAARFGDGRIVTNSEMGNNEIKQFCRLNGESLDLLRSAAAQMRLSARGYNRILKISRTIADLAKSDKIEISHLAEAMQYRRKNNE